MRSCDLKAPSILSRRGSHTILWRNPLEFVFDRFAYTAVIVAKIGQTAEAGHPWRLRGLAGIHFGTAPKPFLQRAASRGRICLGLSKQGGGKLDCGLHPSI